MRTSRLAIIILVLTIMWSAAARAAGNSSVTGRLDDR